MFACVVGQGTKRGHVIVQILYGSFAHGRVTLTALLPFSRPVVSTTYTL